MLKSVDYATLKKIKSLKLSLIIVGCTVLTACNQSSVEKNEMPLEETQVEEPLELSEMPSEEIHIDLGMQHSNFKWDEQPSKIDLYRFSNKDCDIENYNSCDDSQLTTIHSIDELPIKDSFLNEYTQAPTYIKMVSSSYNSEVITADTSIPEFPTRQGTQIIKFDDRMFIIGGKHTTFDTETYYNDIWSSENGIDWQLETQHAQFPARSQHKVIEFNNKLWLFGGEIPRQGGGTSYGADVWSSEDGVNWQLVYEGIYVKDVVVFNERIWAFEENNIYSSETGNEWVQEVSNWAQMFQPENTANPADRFREQFIVFKNKIWLIGGQSNQDYLVKSDVWSSEDGVNWVIETSNAQFGERMGHALAVFEDKLWLSGGYGGRDESLNDIWSSEDGINWTLQNEKISKVMGHQNHQITSFDNKMWLYGDLGDPYLWQSSNGKDWYTGSSISVEWKANK